MSHYEGRCGGEHPAQRLQQLCPALTPREAELTALLAARDAERDALRAEIDRSRALQLAARLHDISAARQLAPDVGFELAVQIGQSQPTRLEIGEVLIFATGPRANTSVLDDVISLGVPFAQVGDCNAPGDFLTAIRDAWMVGLSIDQHPFSGKQV